MDHKGVFARKPVADIIAAEGGAFKSLPKVLGPFSITAMGAGAIIGAGIFMLTGTAAALYAAPALTISFVLAAIACGLVGLCYAELSTLLTGDLLRLWTFPVTLAYQVRKDHDRGGIAHRRRSCPARRSSWRSYGAAG